MFCCAEMRCWRNDVCAMRKMTCRCAAMGGESSQGELFANLQASSPSQLSRAARCQLSPVSYTHLTLPTTPYV